MFSGSPWSSATYRATVSVAFVGIVGALALIATALVEERTNRIESATAQADNISRLVSTYVLQTVEKADIVARDLQEHVTPADMRAKRGENPKRSEELHRLLVRKLAAVPEGSVLHLTNADGEHIYSSYAPLPRISIADREHFLSQKDNPSAGMVISAPVVSRTTGKWAFALTRRLNFEDGSFAGTVSLVVNLDGIERFFATVNVLEHGVVNMRDSQMRLMARYPAAQASIGTPVPDHPALPYITRGLDHAIYQAPGSVDNVMRIYSYQRVDELGMYVFVGLSAEDYLADWRLHLKVYGLSGLVLVLAVLSLVHFARRGALDQAEAQAALVAEEEKFHTIADHTYDWEYWQGADQSILFMSPSCERVTGYRQDAFVADPSLLYRVIHPDDQALMQKHLEDARYADEGTVDFRIVRRDGEIRWITHGCRAVFGHDGQFMGRRASNLDITERKRAEDLLRDLNAELESHVARRTAELESANKELEDFSYSVSHDMRAPLRAIDGFSRLLLEEHGEALGEEGRHQMETVRRSSRQMAQLIEGILHFLRMRKHRIAPAPLDVGTMARLAFEEFRIGLPAGRRATLEMGELPPAWGDPEMIREVVRNLVSNAIKFASPERDLVVRIGGSAGPAENDYFVADNGVGFDMAYIDKLFKVFERVHRTGEYEGAAVGLAIVRRIVERHGGRVRAEGKVGEGATFHFSLPHPQGAAAG